jgi:hypothetical protein
VDVNCHGLLRDILPGLTWRDSGSPDIQSMDEVSIPELSEYEQMSTGLYQSSMYKLIYNESKTFHLAAG